MFVYAGVGVCALAGACAPLAVLMYYQSFWGITSQNHLCKLSSENNFLSQKVGPASIYIYIYTYIIMYISEMERQKQINAYHLGQFQTYCMNNVFSNSPVVEPMQV